MDAKNIYVIIEISAADVSKQLTNVGGPLRWTEYFSSRFPNHWKVETKSVINGETGEKISD